MPFLWIENIHMGIISEFVMQLSSFRFYWILIRWEGTVASFIGSVTTQWPSLSICWSANRLVSRHNLLRVGIYTSMLLSEHFLDSSSYSLSSYSFPLAYIMELISSIAYSVSTITWFSSLSFIQHSRLEPPITPD